MDDRKIVIEIRNLDSIKGNSLSYQVNKSKTEEEKMKKQKEKAKVILANQAFEQTKSLIKQAVNTSLNKYYHMKEDYMLENDVNAINMVIGKATSFVTTVAGGFVAGGPVGAVIAGAGAIISEGISVKNRWDGIYAEINATNYNKTFTKTRMGLVDGGKGTEN